MDVYNTFNLVSRLAIFQKLQSSPGSLDKFFPFVQQFYARPSPLYFSQASQHGDLLVIVLELNTR